MLEEKTNDDDKSPEPKQLSLFPDASPKVKEQEDTQTKAKKLKLTPKSAVFSYRERGDNVEPIEGLPSLTLPNRWEFLYPKIKDSDVPIQTIIRPVQSGMNVIQEIIEYLKTTGGCQVLVLRANTGSGKTTFLNTLPHYMQNVDLHIKTFDLQYLNEDDFKDELWKFEPSDKGVNLIVLEGREKPQTVPDAYIQNILANVNRFARTKRVPMLFVIPTIEEEVARVWCEHGATIGDLIPEKALYDGSRWYSFPGVPKSKYLEIIEETILALNPPYTLGEYGVSPVEAKTWIETSNSIGDFISTTANKISSRRREARITLKGPRERVWVVYCSPDNQHYDHTYHVINGLVQDDKLKVSPVKLVPPASQAQLFKHWLGEGQWTKLVNTINFLDVRLINLPIITLTTAALAHGTDELLMSFKETKLEKYRKKIPRAMLTENIDWDQTLADKRLQTDNARKSMERTNLFRLLRDMPAEQQKGGNPEAVKSLAQYLHLREVASETHLHYYLGLTLSDLLEYQRFPGYIDIGTETPLVQGQKSPIPDITIYTEGTTYALEFHFLKKQIAASEIQTYAIKNVLQKYMRDLPYLNSQLQEVS